MSRIRIGIDARAAAEVPAGKGRFVREVLQELARRTDEHEYVLYSRLRWKDLDDDERFSWRLRQLPEAVWHVWAARAASKECDVFLATNSYVTPWFLRIPAAVVVHDLIPFQPGVAANRRAALIERATIRRALRRAQRVFCDSQATKRDLLRLFPSVAPKAVAVQLAVGDLFSRTLKPEELEEVRRRHGLARPFLLCVGTLEPRKNLLRVIEAYARLPEPARTSHMLVIVGSRGWEFDEIVQRAGALSDEVKLLGHVTDEDLAALYRACEIFCYPSLYEGFGLPLLEALASGAPSITSNVSSLPEVGGDAVRYVDPGRVESISAAMEELLGSPGERKTLSERAIRQASRFSWERAVDEMLAQLIPLVSKRRS